MWGKSRLIPLAQSAKRRQTRAMTGPARALKLHAERPRALARGHCGSTVKARDRDCRVANSFWVAHTSRSEVEGDEANTDSRLSEWNKTAEWRPAYLWKAPRYGGPRRLSPWYDFAQRGDHRSAAMLAPRSCSWWWCGSWRSASRMDRLERLGNKRF